MFACECFCAQNLSVKKNKLAWNCPGNLNLLYYSLLLVVNLMVKVHWSHKHLKDVFLKKNPAPVKLKPLRCNYGNRKSTGKLSLTCFKSILINSVFQLFIISQLPVKFAVFLKSVVLSNSFYSLFFLSTNLYNSIALKTRTAMNAKMSVFVIWVEAIICLLLYKLHDCTFKYNETFLTEKK